MFEVIMASRAFDNLIKIRKEWGKINFSMLVM